MERSDILYFYQSVIFNCGVLLFFFYFIVRKKKFFNDFGRRVKGGEKGENLRNPEIIFRACVMVIAILFGSTCIPDFKDIPYAKNKDFNTVTGVVKFGDTSRNDTVRKRYIRIVEDETNKEIHIKIRAGYVESGEVMTVVYLPNSGFGSRVQTVIQESNKDQQTAEEKQQSGTGKLLGTLAGLTILIAVMRAGIKLLKRSNDAEEDDIVKMPTIYKQIGEFILITGVFVTVFFIIYHAYMHVKIIGIPLILIGTIFYYSTCHWKIIVNSDGIVIVHSFKPRQTVPFSSISKIVLKNIYTINSELGENMDIYVNGKKTTNLDECYKGYQYLKEILIKNNIIIEQK